SCVLTMSNVILVGLSPFLTWIDFVERLSNFIPWEKRTEKIIEEIGFIFTVIVLLSCTSFVAFAYSCRYTVYFNKFPSDLVAENGILLSNLELLIFSTIGW